MKILFAFEPNEDRYEIVIHNNCQNMVSAFSDIRNAMRKMLKYPNENLNLDYHTLEVVMQNLATIAQDNNLPEEIW